MFPRGSEFVVGKGIEGYSFFEFIVGVDNGDNFREIRGFRRFPFPKN